MVWCVLSVIANDRLAEKSARQTSVTLTVRTLIQKFFISSVHRSSTLSVIGNVNVNAIDVIDNVIDIDNVNVSVSPLLGTWGDSGAGKPCHAHRQCHATSLKVTLSTGMHAHRLPDNISHPASNVQSWKANKTLTRVWLCHRQLPMTLLLIILLYY